MSTQIAHIRYKANEHVPVWHGQEDFYGAVPTANWVRIEYRVTMTSLNRRSFVSLLAGGAAASAVPVTVLATGNAGFFSNLAERARKAASLPYQPPPFTTADVLKNLTPDEFAQIRFKPESALWSGSDGYEVWFLKPGVYANELITINDLANGKATPVSYDPDAFSAPDSIGGNAVDAGGFNGFKVLYPLHPQNDWKDELIVFRGASYFRFLGRNQWYGLSARGLAIDSGGDGPEEFPLFREFWLQQPDSPNAPLTIYALLDSESVCGAYRFDILPGDDTEIEVSASVHPRKKIDRLGLAPLTSMFIRDRDSKGYEDKGAIHDSDGLAMLTGTGEWIWRPLVKRRKPAISGMKDDNPRGFGLFQRNQNADDYDTPDFNYHRRPSYWVEPVGSWGPGQVELIEFQNGDVDFDNIVAFWRPAAPAEPGNPLEFSYRITATRSVPGWANAGHVISERVEPVDSAGQLSYLEARIDFQGSRLFEPVGINQKIEVVFESRDGAFEEPTVSVDQESRRVRVETRIRNIETETTELRAYLKRGDDVLTETWSYLWIA